MPVLPSRVLRYGLAAAACAAMAGCGLGGATQRLAGAITPYRVEVVQGNFVSKEQVEQLKAGMTRDQVKATLGTPLMASLFHADRWDYVFTLKRQGVEPQSYKYTVYFKNDQLERFEGDAMPSETEFIAKLGNRRKLGEVPVLEATEEQLVKAAGKSRPAADSAAATSASAPAGAPAASYPPLESPKQ